MKNIMKQKLGDVSRMSNVLRQQRHRLREKGRKLYKCAEWKKLVSEIEANAVKCKREQRMKNEKKYDHCTQIMGRARTVRVCKITKTL